MGRWACAWPGGRRNAPERPSRILRLHQGPCRCRSRVARFFFELATGRVMMQGTLVMLVALSGLGCHNKGCDIAYGPPTYTSCFGGGYSGCYADVYPGPAMPACYGGCYGGGYSGCYGGYSSAMPAATAAATAAAATAAGMAAATAAAATAAWPRRRLPERAVQLLPQEASGLLRLRLRLHGPGVLRFGLCAGGLRIGPGDDLRPTRATSGQSMTVPSKQWGGSTMTAEHGTTPMPSEVTTPWRRPR